MDNVQQILIGLALEVGPRLIWANAVKAMLEIWFERKQTVFLDKQLGCLDRFVVARWKECLLLVHFIQAL